VIGRTLTVSDVEFRVIGIMPEDFSFPSKDTQLGAPAEAVPNWQARRQDRRAAAGTVIGRLRQGVALDQARAEMQGITAQLLAEYLKENEDRASAVNGEHSALVESILLSCPAGVLGVPFAAWSIQRLCRRHQRDVLPAWQRPATPCRLRELSPSIRNYGDVSRSAC
jgi:hypothetical protein